MIGFCRNRAGEGNDEGREEVGWGEVEGEQRGFGEWLGVHQTCGRGASQQPRAGPKALAFSMNRQTLTEQLLCAGYCARRWGFRAEMSMVGSSREQIRKQGLQEWTFPDGER